MAADFASDLAAALAAVPVSSSKTGVFVQRDGSKARVNLNGTTVSLPFVGMYLPPTGHPVQLELRNDQLVVTGPARPLPGVGRITGTGSPRATVTAWDQAYLLPYRSGYTPTMNDNVEIAWTADGGVIQGKVTALSTEPPPLAAGAPSVQTYRPDPFTAIDSGSYRGGWWTNDVYASDNNAGAWFYGSKIKDTIPDGAVIKGVAIYLSPRQEQGSAPILRLHSSPSRPGGSVAFVGTGVALGARSGWVPIPTSLIDYLKANDGGLGMDKGGFSIFRGRGSDDQSGALDITWEA